MRLPVGARAENSVPPPAPEPTMMTSYWVDMRALLSGARRNREARARRRDGLRPSRRQLRVPAAEDAGLGVVVVELRAEHTREPAPPHVHLGRQQHAEGRREKVDPERFPRSRRP